MKAVILFQVFIMASGGLALFSFAPHKAYSYLAGSAVILLSFWLLGVAWGLIFKKKLVALAIGIIVFKYAILGIIIFRLFDQKWLDRLWFSLGVASFTFSALFYAAKEALKTEPKEGKENGI